MNNLMANWLVYLLLSIMILVIIMLLVKITTKTRHNPDMSQIGGNSVPISGDSIPSPNVEMDVNLPYRRQDIKSPWKNPLAQPTLPTNQTQKEILATYIEWLMSALRSNQKLPKVHRDNLDRLRHGQVIKYYDIPIYDRLPLPMTAQQYFRFMSRSQEPLIPRQNETAGVQVPANYADYSTFENPKILKHLVMEGEDNIPSFEKTLHRDSVDVTIPQIEHSFTSM